MEQKTRQGLGTFHIGRNREIFTVNKAPAREEGIENAALSARDSLHGPNLPQSGWLHASALPAILIREAVHL